jgi:hypothetical protein
MQNMERISKDNFSCVGLKAGHGPANFTYVSENYTDLYTYQDENDNPDNPDWSDGFSKTSAVSKALSANLNHFFRNHAD